MTEKLLKNRAWETKNGKRCFGNAVSIYDLMIYGLATQNLGSGAVRCGGSNPPGCTLKENKDLGGLARARARAFVLVILDKKGQKRTVKTLCGKRKTGNAFTPDFSKYAVWERFFVDEKKLNLAKRETFPAILANQFNISILRACFTQGIVLYSKRKIIALRASMRVVWETLRQLYPTISRINDERENDGTF